jgi:hypothetical protein
VTVSRSGDRSHTQTYLLPAPIQDVWRAFTDPGERTTWFGFPIDAVASASEIDPPRYLRQAVDHPGLPGPTETAVTFESVEGGTRVVHVHDGFGDGPVWAGALQAAVWGVDEMMADLALYLRTGVGSPRHVVFSCFDLLKGTREIDAGLEVFEVMDGTIAAQVGLEPGDIVIGCDGAGVFGFREVMYLTRSHKPGDTVELTWLRGATVMRGRGELTGLMPLRV